MERHVPGLAGVGIVLRQGWRRWKLPGAEHVLEPRRRHEALGPRVELLNLGGLDPSDDSGRQVTEPQPELLEQERPATLALAVPSPVLATPIDLLLEPVHHGLLDLGAPVAREQTPQHVALHAGVRLHNIPEQ
jgi:hypothetical protein